MVTKLDKYIDYDKFDHTNPTTNPFPYMVVESFIKEAYLDNIIADFPLVDDYGSFPLQTLESGPEFLAFIEELKGEKFRKLVEKKFDIDLTGKPIMITARGMCKDNNGQIHIDSKGKVITVLVYMNKNWNSEGGKLRMLRNEHDLEDYVAEITPEAGTLAIFKCTENAWHGHKPFSGVRKSIQLNWVVDDSYLHKEKTRHTISAWIKSFKRMIKNVFNT